MNAYLKEIYDALPRVLGLFDANPLSPTFGYGDRYYWAWKLTDFSNGTFQGAAHGLARLLSSGLLPPSISEESVLLRIEAIFSAADRMRRPNGSMEEAYPFESSYCVTALVAFDLLVALDLIEHRIASDKKEKYRQIVHPMIGYLCRSDETHAFISNHLATASAALLRWSEEETSESHRKGLNLLERILKRQSREGWLVEYEGADPGYQTLALYYLCDILEKRPDLHLRESLCQSVDFLCHFAHPDGSFGGYYGSRNTRFFYPAGIEQLAKSYAPAAALSEFMRSSILNHSVVTLASIDEPNLVPMFNAYCWAATIESKAEVTDYVLPCLRGERESIEFREAGLLIENRKSSYTIVSVHKGGVCYGFDKGPEKECDINVGAVICDDGGRLFSTQSSQANNHWERRENCIVVESEFVEMLQQVPTQFQFVVLRLMNLTLMRIGWINERIKRLLVKMLITQKRRSGVKNVRSIRLGGFPRILDRIEGPSEGFRKIEPTAPFSAIHMASQGYWQRQDDVPSKLQTG